MFLSQSHAIQIWTYLNHCLATLSEFVNPRTFWACPVLGYGLGHCGRICNMLRPCGCLFSVCFQGQSISVCPIELDWSLVPWPVVVHRSSIWIWVLHLCKDREVYTGMWRQSRARSHELHRLIGNYTCLQGIHYICQHCFYCRSDACHSLNRCGHGL